MKRILVICALLLVRCTSPGQAMRSEHPEFWAEILGDWEILPEGQTTTVRIEFSANSQIRDPESFLCGKEATPHYWTGQTPAGTIFKAEQASMNSRHSGSAALQKMEFKRGQFMVVCTGQKMNYVDYIVFYGLDAKAKPGAKDGVANYKVAVIKAEDGSSRRFMYRRIYATVQ